MQQQVGEKLKAEYEISFHDFLEKLHKLEKYYHEQQKLYKERPSRDEDREQIRQLQQDLQDRDFQIIKLNEQINILQQELQNSQIGDINFISQQNHRGFNQVEDQNSQEIKQLKHQLQQHEEEIQRLNKQLIIRDNSQNQMFNVHSQLNGDQWNITDNKKNYPQARRSHIILKQ